MSKNSFLPWNFEAFRRFISYGVMQQACAALLAYENEPLFSDESMLSDFSSRLNKRTGVEWEPRRKVSEGVLFNTEGSVFRNKKRVFTSLYTIDPGCFETGKLVITNFGKALGYGFITEPEYYELLISNYEYPHQAYDDNWMAWNNAEKKLRPLLFLLSIMYAIYEKDGVGTLNADEIARFAFNSADNLNYKIIAKEILDNRKVLSKAGLSPRSKELKDKIDRKINDIFGFLCLSHFAYYEADGISLNLMDKHNEEKTNFWEKRIGQNKKEYIHSFITSNL